MKLLMPGFEQLLEPGRRRATESAALGEQTTLQGLTSDAARRGLLGSGAFESGKTSIRAGRQAQVGEALTRFYESALRGAMGEAGRIQQLKVGTILGSPKVAQTPGWANILGGIGGALGGADTSAFGLPSGAGTKRGVQAVPGDDYLNPYVYQFL